METCKIKVVHEKQLCIRPKQISKNYSQKRDIEFKGHKLHGLAYLKAKSVLCTFCITQVTKINVKSYVHVALVFQEYVLILYI